MKFTLFKNKQAQSNAQSLIELSKHTKPVLEVSARSDLEEQLCMLDLTKTDLAVAQALKPYIEAEIVDIINRFYKDLEHHAPLLDIITKYSSSERLNESFRTDINKMISGIMNENFIVKRKKITTIPEKIGLTQKWYIASFQKIFHSVTEVWRRNFQA